jgi:hypothetical protein
MYLVVSKSHISDLEQRAARARRRGTTQSTRPAYHDTKRPSGRVAALIVAASLVIATFGAAGLQGTVI